MAVWTFDEHYGQSYAFLDGLDRLGQTYVAEVPCTFCGWAKEPAVLYRATPSQMRKGGRKRQFPRLASTAASVSEVRNLLNHSPAFRDQPWTPMHIKDGEKGPIVRGDGKKRGGFKGAGYKLSPIAARPYVEKRVRDNMSKVPYNYYFVDCDAYGEVYDDYSPFHRASQADDVQARMARLAWIRDTFGVVIGSEGGSSYAAGVIHVAEGMFGPVFGWGDPDLKNKDSDYYLGQYYPPDGPMVFVKQVPMKERYKYFYYDPKFRLPLYEVVFHDSVVTTHQWANGSLKYSNMLDTVALTEMLYMVPPLYHMNLDEFDKHQEIMKSHYAFFSPLHWEVGFAQMTDFNWLSSDRKLQRAVFADRVELVANFSQEVRRYQGINIPGRSVSARWKESGAIHLIERSGYSVQRRCTNKG